jgi:hypothetical protein
MTQPSDKKQWVEDVVAAYENGASDYEICKVMRITYGTFQKYYDETENFRNLVEMGRAMAKAWWYEMGRTNIHNTKFNTSLWMFNMKNRYGWADKTENVNTNENFENLDLDTLEQRLRKMAPSVYKILKPEMTDAEIVSLDAHRPR